MSPHPSHRWIARMPFERCGALWRVRVPEAPCKYTTVDVYDHEHGGSELASLEAARRIRDDLAASMPLPLPITSMVRQYRNGTFAVEFRYEDRPTVAPAWTAAYQRFDELTLRPRAAMVSRTVKIYGYEGAREEVEKAWREKVTEQAKRIDELVRMGIFVLRHGPTIDAPGSTRSRVRIDAAVQVAAAGDAGDAL